MACLTKNEHPGALRKRSNEHAAFGTVIHAGAGAHWKGESARQAVLESWKGEFSSDTKKYSLELALGMMDAYVRKAELVPLVPGRFIVKSIETRISIQIGRFNCTFMMDRLLADTDSDRYLFVDTKTASTLRAGWDKSYDVSLQMKLYKYAIWKLYGSIPDGVIEGVSKKVPTDMEYHLLPDWDESILEEAALQFIRVAEADEQLVAVATVNGQLNTDLLWELSATQTAFNDNDCYAYGAPCPFLAICNAPLNERLALLKGEYTTYEPDWIE